MDFREKREKSRKNPRLGHSREAGEAGEIGGTTKARALERLRASGLRLTAQRADIAQILFSGKDRHITAEALHQKLKRKMSLATVYNTLNLMTKVGLLQRVAIHKDRVHFDTNMQDHHHFYDETSGDIMDFPSEGVWVKGLPRAPEGRKISSVDVVVRVKRG